MKFLKKLQKAMKKEQKIRNKYIKAKTTTYKMAEALNHEYRTGSEERKEAGMILAEFGLTDDFSENEKEQCKEEHLTIPNRTFEDEVDANEIYE